MYFITVDVNGYITGIYDGSKDYVHRVTGEPIDGAKQVPEGAFKIGQMCVDKIRTAAPDTKAKWDGTCIVQVPLTEEDEVKAQLRSVKESEVIIAENLRIDALTLEEAKAELGV